MKYVEKKKEKKKKHTTCIESKKQRYPFFVLIHFKVKNAVSKTNLMYVVCCWYICLSPLHRLHPYNIGG